jgi:hypothetical protein
MCFSFAVEAADIWGVSEEDTKMEQAFGASVGGGIGHE